jgi:hypothetical protein
VGAKPNQSVNTNTKANNLLMNMFPFVTDNYCVCIKAPRWILDGKLLGVEYTAYKAAFPPTN